MIRKFVSAREAVSRVPDNAVVAISGFNAATAPFYLIRDVAATLPGDGAPQKPVYNPTPSRRYRGLGWIRWGSS